MPSPPDLDRDERLDAVLAEYLAAARAGAAPDRQALLDRHPDLADDLASFFADQDRFDNLAAPLRGFVPPAVQPDQPRDFGDYELIEEIARGGMGVVFRAWQKGLGRVVAVKMLLAGRLAGHDDVQRFRREAETAAALDHPHIVPIHEVGAHDGHPYLCMKLIEGGSLAQQLAGGAWVPGQPDGPREAARLVATIARAVHYAHQRGILHRDLKPANILLDADGRPHVSDFGLAKHAPRDARSTPLPAGTPTGVLTGPLLTALTHTGAVLGTPAYMAPEQATGTRDAVTTAADVYGLGAILYELLAGRPPFRGASPLDTLRQVVEHEPARPRTLNPCVDRDLEVICLECLAKDPGRRYASAAALADDLERYLAGESIQARPVGALERAWRRARRQPVITGLAAALAVAVVMGFALVTWQWRRAESHALVAEARHREAEDQRREAETKRDEARTAQALAAAKQREAAESFQLAHDAVLDLYATASRELAAVAGVQGVRKRLLKRALAYYRKFVQRRSDNRTLRVQQADAFFNIGRIEETIGSRAQARTAYHEALGRYREGHEARPGDRLLWFRLGHTLGNLSLVADSQEEGLAWLAEARGVYAEGLCIHPGDLELRSGLANALLNMGVAHIDSGRLDDGRECLREAAMVQDGLMHDRPKDALYASQKASTLNNLGTLADRVGDRAEALRSFRQAHALYEKLARAFPQDPQRQADLAGVCHNLGIALRNDNQDKEALHYFAEALSLRRKLADANLGVTRYASELAASYRNLGTFHEARKRYDKALAAYAESRKVLDRLRRRDAVSPDLRKDLAVTHYYAGNAYGGAGRPREQRQAYRDARVLQEPLVQGDPGNLNYRIDLANTLFHLGTNLWSAKELGEARAVLHQGIDVLAVALQRAPKVKMFRGRLGDLYGRLADVELRSGRTRETIAALHERQKLWPGNASELYITARAFALVSARVGKGKPELSPEEQAERGEYQDLAIRTLREAVRCGFRDGARLGRETAWQPLRVREDFRQIEQGLKTRVRNGARPPSPGTGP